MADQTFESRRRDPRLKTTFPVEVVCESATQPGHAINISASGLKLVCDHGLPIQEEVEVRLNLAPELHLSLKAQVVWRREVGSLGMSLAGLHFPRDQHSSDALEGWLKTQFAA